VSVFMRDLVYVLYVEEQAQLMHLLGIDYSIEARLQAGGMRRLQGGGMRPEGDEEEELHLRLGNLRQQALALFHRLGRADQALGDSQSDRVRVAERALEAGAQQQQQQLEMRALPLNADNEPADDADNEPADDAELIREAEGVLEASSALEQAGRNRQEEVPEWALAIAHEEEDEGLGGEEMAAAAAAAAAAAEEEEERLIDRM